MRKTSFGEKAVIILFFGFLVSGGLVSFSNNSVFASPPAPTPKCSITGLIENVRFEKAYENPCVKTKSCPTDVQLSFPDTYYLSVKIQSVSLKEGDTRFRSCDSLYQTGFTQEIFITKDKVRSGDSFSKGQTITGTAVSFWGASFETYDISKSLVDNSVTDSRYDHAQDYSWVSGQLQYNSLEGGCWSIKFSDKQGNADNYWGIFGLEFRNPQIANKLKEGSFVTIKGTVKGQEFSMACPQNIYTVSSIEGEKSLPETPPIGGSPQSVFEKIKLFFDGILNSVLNFINGVKSTETTTKYN